MDEDPIGAEPNVVPSTSHGRREDTVPNEDIGPNEDQDQRMDEYVESDLESEIDFREYPALKLNLQDCEIGQCKLPDHRFIYVFTIDSTREDILEFFRGIYQQRKGQIHVICGGHGHPSGENWGEINNQSDKKFKFPDQKIYEDISRGVQLIDDNTDDRRVTLLQLQNMVILDILANERSAHIIFAYCDSINDKLFLQYLEQFHKRAGV